MNDVSPLKLSSLLTVTDDCTLLAYNELTEIALFIVASGVRCVL